MRQAGYSAQQLRTGGFSAADLKSNGWDEQSVVAAGYSVAQLRRAGFERRQLSRFFSSEQLFEGGFFSWDNMMLCQFLIFSCPAACCMSCFEDRLPSKFQDCFEFCFVFPLFLVFLPLIVLDILVLVLYKLPLYLFYRFSKSE